MSALSVEGIHHIAVEVGDLKRSQEFYCRLLGFEYLGRELWPDCGCNVSLKAAGGCYLILSESPQPRALPETGVHQAYRIAAGARSAVRERLETEAVQVHSYREDRPAEEKDNFYFYDPDGNRIQLVVAETPPGVAAAVLGIDHAAVEAVDLEWAEDFYVKALGLKVDHRVGWSTVDYVRAKLWGEGKEEMAPGTRRWDQRYTTMDQKRRLPRPNTQFFVRFGDAVLGIFLALEHRQEPAEEQRVGTPRIGFRASREALDAALRLLTEHRFPAHELVAHPASAPIAASLYFKDPGGNFLELCVAR